MQKNLKQKFGDYLFVGVATFILGLFIGTATPVLKPFVRQTALKVNSKIANITHKGFYLPSSNFSLYWQIYKDLKNKYVDVDKVDDDKKLYYGTIKGLVAAVNDPATLFLDPEETKEYEQSLSPNYEGIGAVLEDTAQGVMITGVFDGAPAKKAGLKPKDIIIAVNKTRVIGKKAREVAKLIRGKANTKVVLTIVRTYPQYEKKDITIIRGKITVPSSRLVKVQDKIAVIRVSRFTDTTLDIWTYNLHKIMSNVYNLIQEGKVKGIIIDLRGNPGGYLDGAINFASYFLPNNTVVSYMQTRKGIQQVYKVQRQDISIPGSIPVVILVDDSSASASEIFTGAMQYYKRAYVIGTKTFGKGTVQKILSYPDGSTLHITIAHWLLPTKQRLTHDKPVIPDKIVNFDYKLMEQKNIDNQMQEALKYIKSKIIKK